jgi:D-alanyl-lipoteichoic acid acyltransferase DltB (MBOAT superfamily)
MIFNSLDFAIFLPIVFGLYWLLGRRSRTAQNAIVVLASYTFYGFWDWRFLSLILFSTGVDFFVGRALGRSEDSVIRKRLLWLSVAVNLGLLGFFKYYNFFVEELVNRFLFAGGTMRVETMRIILPVGISFYTFQTLSYTIDVYRRKMEPTTDFLGFASFVSFFPQLVAGPIERATHLLPQFYSKRSFNDVLAVAGLRQVLWGLLKKVVIANQCAEVANEIFNNYDHYHGSTLVLGAVMFAFQIYGDFSGYSDIAIGTSKLFGFDLKQNFNYPYFSRDIAEFWRRWHISLSTWFRDYLYIPLGGSRGTVALNVRNVFIIFLVSGFWHGANWTFIVWGAVHALFFLPLLLLGKNRVHLSESSSSVHWKIRVKEMGLMLLTFVQVSFAWIFFRSNDLGQSWDYIQRMVSEGLISMPAIRPKELFVLIVVFLMIEWKGRRGQFAIESLGAQWPATLRYAFYFVLIFSLFWFSGAPEQFIYFQF